MLVLAASSAAAPAARADTGDVTPWLGVSFEGTPTVRVSEVFPRTAAARAGVLAGDEIIGIDDDPVGTFYVLKEHVLRREVGARLRLTVLRDGRELTLAARLTAMPTPGELLEQRLLGAPLPDLELAGERVTGRVALLTVFDARCEPCGRAASTLAELARARRVTFDVRAVIVGSRVEIAAYLGRNPIAGAVARWETSPEPPRGNAVLAGLPQASEAAILVVDEAGVVQFAASSHDVDAVADGALAAAARVQQGGRRASVR